MVQKSGSGKCGSIITISKISILLGSQQIYLFKDFGKKLRYFISIGILSPVPNIDISTCIDCIG